MTSELFARLIISDDVVNRIKEYRNHLPELDRLKQEISNRELLIDANPDPKEPMNADLKREIKQLQDQCRKITQIKSSLPVLMYQATFDKTASKKGYQGYWRKQSAARLNGLFMLDVDHMESEELKVKSEEFAAAVFKQRAKELGILLVHVTPSGRGLRIVAKADAAIGNLADNQAWLSSLLGVEPDKACKDASRCSFCPGFEDILYINKEELFTYENKEYDEKWGPTYRGESLTHNSLTHKSLTPSPSLKERGVYRTDADNLTPSEKASSNSSSKSNHSPLPERGVGGEAVYRGIPYSSICRKWFDLVCKGTPKPGDRHQSLYRLACDLRYITDFDPKLLARVIAECEVGRDVAEERGSAEIERLAADACALQHYRTIPKRMQEVLRAVGVLMDDGKNDEDARKSAAIDYDYWWHRLEPLLSDSPGYKEAVATLPDHHKLAGVLAAGAMLGTYLTRTWWEHFDGRYYRLSFLVYIVGSAASGKSFITELDRLIMAPMLAADRVGREWERQYKEDMKKRAASSKNAKSEAPEQQHPVIRYVPSTISNAMLYRRLTDAIDNDAMGPDEQPMHLHCYTIEPELATALRAQTGSWAGKNDLELKSFHNETAGVDYANDQSTNGIIQVNWNQVVTGTQEAMNRKIKPSMVLDGLVTRLVLFPMPSNDFVMIERRTALRDHEREALLRSIGLRLEQVKGQLKADRLVDFCYKYEHKLTKEAELEQDYCLDYFRKRIPVIMMRYTLVRIVCRMILSADSSVECRTESVEFATAHPSPKPSSAVANSKLYTLNSSLKIEDSDFEFARLIGDWCLMAQMHMFGQMVMDAREREMSNYVPRKRSSKVREAYAKLPELINTELLVSEGLAKNVNAAGSTLRRWLADGLVAEVNDKNYRKCFKEIPE